MPKKAEFGRPLVATGVMVPVIQGRSHRLVFDFQASHAFFVKLAYHAAKEGMSPQDYVRTMLLRVVERLPEP